MRCSLDVRAYPEAAERDDGGNVGAEVLQLVEVLRPHLEVVGALGRHHVLQQPHSSVQGRRRGVQEHLLQTQRRSAVPAQGQRSECCR